MRIPTLVLAAAVAAAAAQSAHADGWRLPVPMAGPPSSVGEVYSKNVFYIEPTFEYQWRALGQFKFGRTSPANPNPIIDKSVNVDGVTPGLAFGMRLPGTWAPPWVGQNLRVEVSGNWFNLVDRQHEEFTLVAQTGRFPFVNGAPAAATGGTSGFDLRTEMQGFETALRIASDIAIGRDLILTPGISVFGGASLTRYRLVLIDTCQSARAPCFQDTVHESIRVREIGGTLSLGARYVVHSGVSLILGGGVSIVHTHARLNAADCFDVNPVSDGCQFAAAASTTATATLNRWGYRLFGQGGLGLELGFARVDMLGGIRYASVVPQVRNPTAVTGQTATLGSSGQIGYSAQLRVSIPLDFF